MYNQKSSGEPRVFQYRPEEKWRDKKERPILFISGWGTPAHVHGVFIQRVADLMGRTVYGVEYSPDYRATDKTRPVGFPISQIEKAEMLLKAIRKVGEPKVDIIAYSEGCLNAIAVTAIDSSFFGDFYFIAPAGMLPKSSPAIVFMRGVLNNLQNKNMVKDRDLETKKRIHNFAQATKNWYWNRGPFNSIRRMEPGYCDHSNLVATLTKDQHQVHVLLFRQDIMLPCQEIQKRLKELEVPHCVTEGSHFEILFSPEKVARIISLMIRKP